MKRVVLTLLVIVSSAALSIALLPDWRGRGLPEASHTDIEFQNVAEALTAVKEKPGIEISTEHGGWTIARDYAAATIWSFAPKGHPAYPTVVKRFVVPAETGSVVKMSVICESDKRSCDDVVTQFQKLNERAFGSAN